MTRLKQTKNIGKYNFCEIPSAGKKTTQANKKLSAKDQRDGSIQCVVCVCVYSDWPPRKTNKNKSASQNENTLQQQKLLSNLALLHAAYTSESRPGKKKKKYRKRERWSDALENPTIYELRVIAR